jgi:hypothetical protein
MKLAHLLGYWASKTVVLTGNNKQKKLGTKIYVTDLKLWRGSKKLVFRIRIHKFLGLPDPDLFEG